MYNAHINIQNTWYKKSLVCDNSNHEMCVIFILN